MQDLQLMTVVRKKRWEQVKLKVCHLSTNKISQRTNITITNVPAQTKLPTVHFYSHLCPEDG